jgi:hypothetical protein
MNKVTVFLTLFCLLLTQAARGLEVRSGQYSQTQSMFISILPDGSRETNTPAFRITRQGNAVTVFDIDNKLTYNFDLGSAQEQYFPQAYFDYLRNKKHLGALASVVKAITLTNITETQDKVTANLNIVAESQSLAFGTLRVRATLSATATRDQCDLIVSSANGTQSVSKMPCLTIQVGDRADVTSVNMSIVGVNSNWYPIFNNAFSLLLDFALKMSGLQWNDTLTRIPKI